MLNIRMCDVGKGGKYAAHFLDSCEHPRHGYKRLNSGLTLNEPEKQMFVATCGTSPSVCGIPRGIHRQGCQKRVGKGKSTRNSSSQRGQGWWGPARRSTGEAKLVVFKWRLAWPTRNNWTHSGCHKLGRLLLTLRGLEARGTAKCPTRHKPASPSITQREIILTQMS